MIRIATAVAAVVALQAAALATGPRQQTVTPRAHGHTLNAAVRVNSGGGIGTGSIIAKKIDAEGNGWFCVLTADHNVRGNANHSIRYEDADGVRTIGDHTSWYLTMSPPGVRSYDLAVLGVRYGPRDAFFDGVNPIALTTYPDRDPANPGNVTRHKFTQIGFGDSGDFVNGGMNGFDDTPNTTKRFQNNQIERWVQGFQGTGNVYDYFGIEFTFDVPTAHDVDRFLSGEGLSFIGDSGGPYLMAFEAQQNVARFRDNIRRNQDGSGDLIPNWPGGDMPLWSNVQFAVHAFGNSNAAGFNPFGRTGGAVPLVRHVREWIDFNCHVIPAPPGAAAFALAGIVLAFRRRR